MVANPAVRKVNFTGELPGIFIINSLTSPFQGSTPVGAKIAEMAGRHLKPVVMELGGAAPLIVLEDADIEHAANNAVHGSFFHSGKFASLFPITSLTAKSRPNMHVHKVSLN